jgi:hypothetical protein
LAPQLVRSGRRSEVPLARLRAQRERLREQRELVEQVPGLAPVPVAPVPELLARAPVVAPEVPEVLAPAVARVAVEEGLVPVALRRALAAVPEVAVPEVAELVVAQAAVAADPVAVLPASASASAAGRAWVPVSLE